jgi:hypothetical protein
LDKREVTTLQPTTDCDSDDEELDRLQAGFPQFRIWREIICDRARYVARREDPGARPHTVVTADLDELRAALSAGACQPRPDRDRGPGARDGTVPKPGVSAGGPA